MKMEERNQYLKNLNKSDRDKDIQNHLEIVTRERKLSRINEEAVSFYCFKQFLMNF